MKKKKNPKERAQVGGGRIRTRQKEKKKTSLFRSVNGVMM